MKQDEKTLFVIAHYPRNHGIFNSAKRFLPLLEQSKNAISKENFLQSKSHIQQLNFHQNCSNPGCGSCDVIQDGKEITSGGQFLKHNAPMKYIEISLI